MAEPPCFGGRIFLLKGSRILKLPIAYIEKALPGIWYKEKSQQYMCKLCVGYLLFIHVFYLENNN